MVTIRPERPEDAEAVAAVHVRGWQGGYAGIMPDDVLSRLDVAEWARRRRRWRTAEPDQPFATLVAEDDDGTVIGFVTVGPYRNDQDREDTDARYGEILAMYVDPAHWGTGVGRELMAAAVAELAARGWTEIRLWVLEANARARRFYERAGLLPDGERSTYPVPRAPGLDPVDLEEIRYSARLDIV